VLSALHKNGEELAKKPKQPQKEGEEMGCSGYLKRVFAKAGGTDGC
jgi:hypothetical protein